MTQTTQTTDSEIEERFQAIRRLVNASARYSAPELQGLSERIQVELLITRVPRRRRQVYRAFVDLLEAEFDDREEQEEDAGEASGGAVLSHVKRLLAGMDD